MSISVFCRTAEWFPFSEAPRLRCSAAVAPALWPPPPRCPLWRIESSPISASLRLCARHLRSAGVTAPGYSQAVPNQRPSACISGSPSVLRRPAAHRGRFALPSLSVPAFPFSTFHFRPPRLCASARNPPLRRGRRPAGDSGTHGLRNGRPAMPSVPLAAIRDRTHSVRSRSRGAAGQSSDSRAPAAPRLPKTSDLPAYAPPLPSSP